MSEFISRKVDGEGLGEFLDWIKREGEFRGGGVPQFLCIGTDRSCGDSLGPLTGTLLAETGYKDVIGTLEYPCDANNIAERLLEIDPSRTTIAIDACLGQLASSVGMYQVFKGPVEPGKSLGKQLPPAGDYTIAAIVNLDGRFRYRILQNTSMHRVYTMSREIVSAVKQVFPV
jgi:putative sporulation protein YyaC